jgi:hypothetical protein
VGIGHETLERYNISSFRNFKQLGCTGEGYGINDLCFANLATFGTGNSDENRNFVFYQVHEVRSGLIAGGGHNVVNHAVFDQNDRVIRKKKTDVVTVFVGSLGQLKRPRDPRRVFQSPRQYKHEFRHLIPPFSLLSQVPFELKFDLFKIAFPLMLYIENGLGRNGDPFTGNLDFKGFILFQAIG